MYSFTQRSTNTVKHCNYNSLVAEKNGIGNKPTGKKTKFVFSRVLSYLLRRCLGKRTYFDFSNFVYEFIICNFKYSEILILSWSQSQIITSVGNLEFFTYTKFQFNQISRILPLIFAQSFGIFQFWLQIHNMQLYIFPYTEFAILNCIAFIVPNSIDIFFTCI